MLDPQAICCKRGWGGFALPRPFLEITRSNLLLRRGGGYLKSQYVRPPMQSALRGGGGFALPRTFVEIALSNLL